MTMDDEQEPQRLPKTSSSPSSSSSSSSLRPLNNRFIVNGNQNLSSSNYDNNCDEAFEEFVSSISSNSECQPINIRRHIFYTEDFYSKNSTYNHHQQNHSTKNNIDNNESKSCCSFITDPISKVSRSLWSSQTSPSQIKSKSIIITWLQTVIPILHWLPNYDFRHDLLNDIIAGCTILALHIPQGLAYGRLAGVEPINGLYVSLFPVIIYAIFGTSRQVSIGTFAVISIACRDALESFDLHQSVILKENFHTKSLLSSTTNGTTINHLMTTTPSPIAEDLPTPIEILSTLALFVGIIQFLMGFLKLGILSIILSETLISAFVTACSYHVFTSQIFALIDVDSKANGDDFELPLPFDILKSWSRFIVRIPKANPTTVIISAICIAILILFKFGISPYLMRRFKLKNLVIPIDILAIIFATLISSLMDLNDNYHVKIIPAIPKAFQGLPKIPDVSYMGQLWVTAILITFVSYISTYSLGKIFAKEHGYEVSANQELIAIGSANLLSSFFLCYPCSGSLARSAVMNRVGARTQLASIVSSILLILFLLFFSSYLRTLPMSILSCIIVVALWGNMKQVVQIRHAWHVSKLDGILWIVTFLLVLLFGIGHGLLYSVIFSLIILIIRLIIPIIKLKRQIKGTEVFVEINHIYDVYDPITGQNKSNESTNQPNPNKWVVFEFQGPLIFINSIIFRRKFHSLIGRYLLNQRTINNRHVSINQDQLNRKKSGIQIALDLNDSITQLPIIETIIFDCTRLTYIDQKGVEILIDTINIIEKYDAHMVLASCSQFVYDNLEKNNFFKNFNPRHCYMSVMDAIADLEHNDHHHHGN
ncbi:sulfate transporter-like isoform X2 [Dermatophagoides pteronyssinus]|uniref:sulfate transporter-like isoform X2 n=1 Tax=Dermatophagoides pteronyssinus TaxID=6956 RepID=UPI003F675709